MQEQDLIDAIDMVFRQNIGLDHEEPLSEFIENEGIEVVGMDKCVTLKSGVVMKRRFRQKQDLEPKNDPEKDKGLSDDGAQENVDIDDVIQEIDTHLEIPPDAPEEE